MALTQEQVKKIYVGYLGRGADNLTPEALNLFESEAQLASFIFNSDEAKSKPGYPSILTIETVSAYINQIYQNLFGRAADDAAAGAQLVLSGVIAVDQAALFIANQAVPGSSDYDNLQRAIAQNKPVGLIGETFMLTEGVDYADADKSTHDDVADPSGFKFTDTANEQITTTLAQLGQGDKLVDLSNNDNDVITINLTIDDDAAVIDSDVDATLVNIEEIVINSRGAKNATFNDDFVAAGLKTLKITGSFLDDNGSGFTFTGGDNKTLATIDASGVTAGTVTLNAAGASQDLTITGPNSAAVITGGAGNDNITGGAGNDSIIGGAGKDTINGGDGDDVITGGAGADVLTGGAGADKFSFGAGDSTQKDLDIIKDFSGNKAGSGQGDKIVVGTWGGTNTITKYKPTAKKLDDILKELATPGVCEEQTLIINADATSSGNVTITIGKETIEIAIGDSDGSGDVADKIALAINSANKGWTAVSTKSSATVTFTATTSGNKDLLTYSAGSTGASSTNGVKESTPGANGIIYANDNDAVYFEFSGNTYVAQVASKTAGYAAATDLLVQLTGTKLGLEAGDFEAAA